MASRHPGGRAAELSGGGRADSVHVGDHDAEGPRQVGLGVGEAEVRAEEGERLAWTSTIWAVDIELACRNTATSAMASS